MRKFLTSFAILCLLLMVSACGGAEPEVAPTEAPAPAATEAPEEEPEPTEAPAPTEAPEEAPEPEPEASADGSIAVLLPDSASSARWENDDRRFFEEAFDAAGVEYTIQNAEGDASTQQTQAEQAITNGAKVLLLVNLDSGSGAAIIAQAREAGVFVIDYDRLTIEGPGADFYVSFDNESVGRLQGEGLVKAVEDAGIENPKVAILNGSPTDNNATLFKNGYDSVINPLFESGDWTEVDDQSVPDWDNQQALVIFEQMLTAAGGEIDAAVAANDGIAGSVAAAIANQGLDYIPVTGQDATVGGIQNILAGRQSMTVYKAIKAEAQAAADLAVALLNGDDTSSMATGATNNGTNDVPSVLLVPVSVTKDNIEETVIADGFRTWEEICVGEFAQYCPGADAGASSGAMDGSIAVLLPDSASSARWENDDRRFLEAAFEEAGVEYTIVNAEGDASTQQTQAEQAITNGAKVLLLVNLDSGSGAAIIAQAREAGVAVIDYDRLTIQGEGADYYVSFDNESVGRLQGEGLVKAVEEAGIENPKVAVLNGSPTDNNATLFKNGYDSVINPLFESGAWTEVDDQSVPDWDNQQALVIFEQMITAAGGEIDAAVAANDGIAGSVYAALANQGLDPIAVTGQDATVGGIQNILAGRQSMTVYKAIKAEAEAAAALAVAILKGEDTSSLVTGAIDNGTNEVPSVLLVPVSVTKDNIEETVIADGFRTWEEICVGEFAEFCPDAGADAGDSGDSAMVDGSIAVLLPDSASSARWENDDRRFLEAAFEEAGVEYTIVNAEGDASTQQTQAEQAITNGAKVLLLVNLDSGSGAAIIAQAREAGVAVIDYDRLTIQGEGADYYVSFDNESVGRLQGEGLVKAVEEAGIENPNVAVLNGSPTDNNATLFKNGYDSVINPLFESGAWTEVDDQSVPDWDNQQALVIFEQMITASGGEIDAAIAANDGIAGSVYAALANQGLDPIAVTGQDATVGGIQNILAGRQSMTVYKAIKAEAEAAADLAVAILKGDDTSSLVTGAIDNGTNEVPSVLLVPVSVTKDNIEETVIADGFRTWEEICVGDFAQYCPDGDSADAGADAGDSGDSAMVDGSIAVLLPDSASSARWENDDRRFLEAAFEEAGVEYTIVNAEGDASTQQTQAEQAITNGAKVLLLVNLDSGSGAAIIAQAREAGVAVIDYDRLTIQGEGADYYVSFDNESVGRLQGEGLVKAVEEAGIENPNVAVLNGSPTDNNATLFKNGYDSVINPLFESGAWTEVDDQSVPDWDNQQALVIFEQMITASGGEIDAAVAANDGIAGSVYAALANQGLDPIAVTGQDATVGGIQNILAGRQSMTVYKAIKAEAEAAADLAVAILKGESTDDLVTGAINNGTTDVPSVLLVPVSVTKDNIEETVIADGFRTWEEICVGDFAQYCPDGDSADAGDSAPVDGSIAVLLPDSASSARWENDDRRFLEAAFEEAGVEYTIVNAEGDASTQQTQAEQAITNGAKVLLLVNLDSGSGAAIIAQAREAGVAVIDYDRLTIQGDGADFYVSFDNESVGRLQGEGLVKAVEEAGIENPNVAVLNGSPTDNNATLFKNGYDSVINPLFESGAWTEVDDQSVPDWDNQQALVIFEQMITASGGEIDAAVAANDGIAGSVYAALANQGLDPIPVTGQDATVGGIQNILAGRQSMTVYKAIKAEAEAAADLAVAILKGESTDDLVTGAIDNGTNEVPSVLLVPVSVTKDNIEETVIADGFRTWEEICVGDFAEFCP